MVQMVKRNPSGRVPRPKTWQAGLELCLRGTLFDRTQVSDGYHKEAVGDRAIDFARHHPDETLEALSTMISDLYGEGDNAGGQHWTGLLEQYVAWCDKPLEVDPWDTPEPEARKGRKPNQPKARGTDELAAFFAAINRKSASGKRFYAIATLTKNTGARVGEVLNLTLRDLDLEHGAMWIRESKNHKQRTAVVVHLEETRRALEAWFSVRDEWDVESDYVFVSRPGENPRTKKADDKLDYRSVARTFETVSKRAGIEPPVMPHQLRHTFISKAIERGASPAGLCKQTGHVNPNVLLGSYTHVVDKAQRDAVSVLED